MAHTAPRTWVDGETPTAAMLNRDLRDNQNAGWPGSVAGDMDYYTSATTMTRIPIGAEGAVMQVVDGVPAWASFYGASVYTTRFHTHGGSYELVSFDQVEYDYGDFVNASEEIIIPITGLYAIMGRARFQAHTDTALRGIYLDFATADGVYAEYPNVSGQIMQLSVGTIAYLPIGETVSMGLWQDTGGDLDYGSAVLTIVRIK